MTARIPLHFENFDVTFPDDRIIQVTLTRTQKLNCVDKATSSEISRIWERLDEDETLWVGIITGSGRAFCTGADLQGRQTVRLRHIKPNILLTTNNPQSGMR